MSYLLLAIIGIFLCIWFYRTTRRPINNFPPGPPCLPLIGTMLSMVGKKTEPYTSMLRLRKIYGPVFSFKIGPRWTVVISDYEEVIKALKNDSIADRPRLEMFEDFRYVDKIHQVRGVIFSNGKEWQEQRRFTLRHLRDFGFGKSGMEELITEEVKKFIVFLKRETNRPINFANRANLSIVNALWTILMGERLSLEDPVLKVLVHQLDNFNRNASLLNGPLALFPGARNIIPHWLTGYDKYIETLNNLRDFIKPYINNHIKDFDEDDIKDFADIYVREMKHNKEEDSSFYGDKGRDSIQSLIEDLFAAGSDTTSQTLTWIIFLLMIYPEVQEKLQSEIDLIIGHDRMPTLSDRRNLHYTEAVIQEVMRYSSLVFMAVPHCTTKNVKIGSYDVPKNTTVILFLYQIMNDPEYWKNPRTFNPDRFLTENGTFRKDDRWMPFSMGKRQCLGITLAQAEIFLFTVTLFQNFKFTKPPGSHHSNMNGVAGFINASPPFEVILNERV